MTTEAKKAAARKNGLKGGRPSRASAFRKVADFISTRADADTRQDWAFGTLVQTREMLEATREQLASLKRRMTMLEAKANKITTNF